MEAVEAVEAVSFPLTKINSSYMFLLAFPLGNERVVTSKSNLPTCSYYTLLHEINPIYFKQVFFHEPNSKPEKLSTE